MLVGGMIRFTVFDARNGKHFMALIKGCWDDMAYGVWHLYLGAVTDIDKNDMTHSSLFGYVHVFGPFA